MTWRIPLFDLSVDEDEVQAVAGVLRSGWISMGEITRQFEAEFARMHDSKHAIAVCNCTAALHLALKGLGIKEGDEVIVIFPDIGGLSLNIPIHRVGNVIDDKSRTFRIEMKIDNRDWRFKPNMYTMVRVNDFSSDAALIVPAVIIRQDILGSYLYVAAGKDGGLSAEKRYVDMGLSYNDLTMISEGVEPGEKVIIKGYSQVSDGVSVVVR